MKKKLKIVFVAIILIFALLILSGCQNNTTPNEESTNNTTTSLRDELFGTTNTQNYDEVKLEELQEYTKEEDSNYTTFTFSNGASFMYPSNWESVGTEEEPGFISPDGKGASVNIANDTIEEEDNITFAEYIEFQKLYLEQQMSITEGINEAIVNLNGRKAFMLNYVTQTEQNGVTLQLNVTQVAFEENGDVTILTLAVLNDYYSEVQETFDKIVKSLIKA